MPTTAEAPPHESASEELARRAEPVALSTRRGIALGALLAVCGVTGGAGATTLAYLVALAAARRWSEPVLVADTGGPTGGLAAFAGIETGHSLPELAAHLAAGAALHGGIYATGPAAVRVLATGPQFDATCTEDQLVALLAHAREAHGLTVIDCGILARQVDQAAAAAATHLAWIMPATAHGVARGRSVLDALPRTSAKESLVARCESRQTKAPVRELRNLAAERHAPLVLMPHLPTLNPHNPRRAEEAAQVPIQALLGALRR